MLYGGRVKAHGVMARRDMDGTLHEESMTQIVLRREACGCEVADGKREGLGSIITRRCADHAMRGL